MAGGDPCQGVDVGVGTLLAERPRRHLHDEGLGVVEDRRKPDAGTGGGELARTAAHPPVGVAERGLEGAIVEGAEPGERPERAGPYDSRWIADPCPRRSLVAEVAGEHHRPPARRLVRTGVPLRGAVGLAGDAVIGLFRARLAGRRRRPGTGRAGGARRTRSTHPTTMTAADDGTTASGSPLAGQTGEPGPPGIVGEDGPVAGPGGPGRGRRRGRRRVHWGWIVFVALAVAVAVASRVNLDYYALQPGTAQSVQQFITVPADKARPVSHPVLLTDVEIARVTALSYLYFKLQGDTSLDRVDTVTGGTPPSEFGAQGVLEMSQAEQSAEVAALRRLGYSVPSRAAGAVVFATYPGTPAWGVLKVGDVITAVDGAPTTSAAGLVDVVSRYHSGQRIVLSVEKGGTGPARPVAITLHSTLVDLGFGVRHREDLGVQVEDQVDYTLPLKVSIDVANIGGPSAGLAMTLGVIDGLTGGDLTGGKTVAATGTMSASGVVGDVGGVAQKTVAVERAGATIFFVPKQEYKVALSKATKSLHVYAVRSLDQALSILAAHGGSVPPLPAPRAASAASPAS